MEKTCSHALVLTPRSRRPSARVTSGRQTQLVLWRAAWNLSTAMYRNCLNPPLRFNSGANTTDTRG
eukprot:9154772-Prorocentrum_lima.AAC.1